MQRRGEIMVDAICLELKVKLHMAPFVLIKPIFSRTLDEESRNCEGRDVSR